jgi:intein/homing endonuclease
MTARVLWDSDYRQQKINNGIAMAKLVYGLETDRSVQLKMFDALSGALGKYTDELTALGDDGDYARGEAYFAIVSFLVGPEELLAASKTGRFSEAAMQKIEAHADDIERKLAKIPCGCFTEKTKILTSKGYKDISEIKVGDLVWAYDETTTKQQIKKVKEVFHFERDTIFKIYIKGEVLEATSDHPFFIGGKFIKVKDIKAGDMVQLYDGKKAKIDSIILEANSHYSVYNFTVGDYHTYFVGDLSVLVHNSGPCPTKKGGESRYHGDDPKSERVGRQNGNTSRNNQVQNKQIDALAKKYKLTLAEREQLEKGIHGQGLGYREVEEFIKAEFSPND